MASAGDHGNETGREHATARIGKDIKNAAWTVFEKADEVFRGDIIEEAPYGAGSIRVSIRAAGPAGYPVKGDEATRRYFTADSPDYDAAESEVWFANEEAAQNAGFTS